MFVSSGRLNRMRIEDWERGQLNQLVLEQSDYNEIKYLIAFGNDFIAILLNSNMCVPLEIL